MIEDKIKQQITDLEAQRDKLTADANRILQSRLAEVRAATIAEIDATLAGYTRQIATLEALLDDENQTPAE